MNELTTTLEEEDHLQSLRTYLRDHTAGAQHATLLLSALSKEHAGTPVGEFTSDLHDQVASDLQLLEDLATRMGAGDFQFKELGGWFADKLSRLKLMPLKHAFNTFEALEFISLGILGKRALWRALMSVAPHHPELGAVDFASLVERAEAQFAATEEFRLRLAADVFRRSPAP